MTIATIERVGDVPPHVFVEGVGSSVNAAGFVAQHKVEVKQTWQRLGDKERKKFLTTAAKLAAVLQIDDNHTGSLTNFGFATAWVGEGSDGVIPLTISLLPDVSPEETQQAISSLRNLQQASTRFIQKSLALKDRISIAEMRVGGRRGDVEGQARLRGLEGQFQKQEDDLWAALEEVEERFDFEVPPLVYTPVLTVVNRVVGSGKVGSIPGQGGEEEENSFSGEESHPGGENVERRKRGGKATSATRAVLALVLVITSACARVSDEEMPESPGVARAAELPVEVVRTEEARATEVANAPIAVEVESQPLLENLASQLSIVQPSELTVAAVESPVSVAEPQLNTTTPLSLETSQGKYSVSRMTVSSPMMAKEFLLRSGLKIPLNVFLEINHFEPSFPLSVGQEVVIPFSGPFSEANLVRWQVMPGDTLLGICSRFGFPLEAGYKAEERALGHNDPRRLQVGIVLEIRGESPSLPIPVKVENPTGEFSDHDIAVFQSLMRQVYAAAQFTFGDLSFMKEVAPDGIRLFRHNVWGFTTDGGYGIGVPTPAPWAEEDWVRLKFGHEFFHALPFPVWSAASDEGLAVYFGSEIATNSPDYNIDTLRSHYDELNKPELRNREFRSVVGDYGLAALAWERIIDAHPGILEHLMQRRVVWQRTQQDGGWEESVPVELIQQWVEDFSPGAWQTFEKQHILWTE